MTTETVQQLPAAITGKFNIALTQSKFQVLQTKADSLVYNEDNLEEISKFLKDLRGVAKAIDETHKEGKAEALKIGRDWDAAKNVFKGQVESIEQRPQAEYSRICNEVEDRKRKLVLEQQRVLNIKQGIETNSISFAKRISECTTTVQLTDTERLINLEKTRKDKYMEFIEDAAARYSELNSLLKKQKETVKALEENARKQAEAKKQNDDATLLLLQEEQEKQEAKIEENKIVVQETAINQSINEEIQVAQEIIPEVKARRTTWKFEMVNEKEVMKKNPELLIVSLNEDKAKQVLQTLKDTSQLNGKTELLLNGIRYFEVKTF